MPQNKPAKGGKAAKAVAVEKKARRGSSKRAREEEEPEYEDELVADDINFGDVEEDEDDDDVADYGGEDDSVQDDDDFETKAAKYKRQMEREGRIALAEAKSDAKREVKKPVFGDADEYGGADEEAEGEEDGAEAGQSVLDRTAKGLATTHTAEELRDRITETVRALTSFHESREDGHDRDEYLALLKQDLMELYEYNDFLMDKIVSMFPPHEAVEFVEAMEKERPVTIRTNTIKTKRRDLVHALTKRGANVEPLEKWSKVGLQVFESNVPISGTVEYLAGHYMVQSAVSFLPCMALAPIENERVLDMSAAPGGKTTYLAALMKNTGVLFANDVSEPRIKALNANIQRLGCVNTIVTNYDGVGYARVVRNLDRVLLDAPCSGSGIISRDKSIKTKKTLEDIQRHSMLQRRLILSAIDCVNPNSATGGFIVYSTCSFLVEENEAVVQFALQQRHIEIVDTELPFGRPGFTKYRHLRFHPSIAETRRFFPHVHNLDGFYVCKIKKLSDRPMADPNGGIERPLAIKARKDDKKKKAAAAKAAKVATANAAAPKASPEATSDRVSIPPVSRRPAAPAKKAARKEKK